MRTKNIEITMKLPFQVKKPDQNGVVYSQEAILDAIKKSKLGTGSIPLEVENAMGIATIGKIDKLTYEIGNDESYLVAHGMIFHGGTSEDATSNDGSQIDIMKILSLGITLDWENNYVWVSVHTVNDTKLSTENSSASSI